MRDVLGLDGRDGGSHHACRLVGHLAVTLTGQEVRVGSARRDTESRHRRIHACVRVVADTVMRTDAWNMGSGLLHKYTYCSIFSGAIQMTDFAPPVTREQGVANALKGRRERADRAPRAREQGAENALRGPLARGGGGGGRRSLSAKRVAERERGGILLWGCSRVDTSKAVL